MRLGVCVRGYALAYVWACVHMCMCSCGMSAFMRPCVHRCVCVVCGHDVIVWCDICNYN